MVFPKAKGRKQDCQQNQHKFKNISLGKDACDCQYGKQKGQDIENMVFHIAYFGYFIYKFTFKFKNNAPQLAYMCGIIGIFNIEGAETLVIEGLKIMQYRGLEGHGIATDSETKFSKTFEDLTIKSSLNAIGHNLHSVVSLVKQPIAGRG